MKGKLHKKSDGWVVWYNDTPVGGNVSFVDSIPLNPYIDPDKEYGRNMNGQEVEFEIEDFWETGIDTPFKVAKFTRKIN